MKVSYVIEEKDGLNYIKKIIENNDFDYFLTTHKIFDKILRKMQIAGEIEKHKTNFEEGLNYIYDKKVILIW